jgi:hypothetical protein
MRNFPLTQKMPYIRIPIASDLTLLLPYMGGNGNKMKIAALLFTALLFTALFIIAQYVAMLAPLFNTLLGK